MTLISVIVEGYNDALELGSALETLESLARQTYPRENMEVVLTGSQAQAAFWRNSLADDRRFLNIKIIGAEAHYYALKNLGAEAASGEILAFTDSDTLPEPEWLDTIARGIAQGADVTAGITLFRAEDGETRFENLLTVAASISWGFIAGVPARGFLSHNLAMRRSIFEQLRYREDLGRTCAGTFLYQSMREHGLSIRFQPDQRVRHIFTWGWWLKRLHVRFGYEVYLLRRLRSDEPYSWVRRLGWLEPVATMAWHIALDVPQWFRFSSRLGWSRGAQIAYIPVVLAMSLGARGAEAVGMYRTLVNPERMRRFALSS